MKIHGHRRAVDGRPTPTYKSWKAMRDRCLPNHKSREFYFDRGIKVCASWQLFENFLADMGERPNRTQLGRINNDLGYFPGNCEWQSYIANSNNKRDNQKLVLMGRTQGISEWAREVGMGPDTLAGRLEAGWTVIRALTQPLKKQKNSRAPAR